MLLLSEEITRERIRDARREADELRPGRRLTALHRAQRRVRTARSRLIRARLRMSL